MGGQAAPIRPPGQISRELLDVGDDHLQLRVAPRVREHVAVLPDGLIPLDLAGGERLEGSVVGPRELDGHGHHLALLAVGLTCGADRLADDRVDVDVEARLAVPELVGEASLLRGVEGLRGVGAVRVLGTPLESLPRLNRITILEALPCLYAANLKRTFETLFRAERPAGGVRARRLVARLVFRFV